VLAGIVIGASLFALLVGVMLAFLFIRKRNQSKATQLVADQGISNNVPIDYYYGSQPLPQKGQDGFIAEMSSEKNLYDVAPAELAGDRLDPQELDGQSMRLSRNR